MSEKVVLELSTEAAHELEKIISYGGYSLKNIAEVEFNKFHRTAKSSIEEELGTNAATKTSEEIGRLMGRLRPKFEKIGVELPKDATINSVFDIMSEKLKLATQDKEEYAKQKMLDLETELTTAKTKLTEYETKETAQRKAQGFNALLPKDLQLTDKQRKAVMMLIEDEADVKIENEKITFLEKGTERPFKLDGKVSKDEDIMKYFVDSIIPKTNNAPVTATKTVTVEVPKPVILDREALKLTSDSTRPR